MSEAPLYCVLFQATRPQKWRALKGIWWSRLGPAKKRCRLPARSCPPSPRFEARGPNQISRLLKLVRGRSAGMRMRSHLLLRPHEGRGSDSVTGPDHERGSFHRADSRQGVSAWAAERGTLAGQHGGTQDQLDGGPCSRGVCEDAWWDAWCAE